MTTTNPTRPDWVYEGAPAVEINAGGWGPPILREVTIDKVRKRYVETSAGNRFSLVRFSNDGRLRPTGDAYLGPDLYRPDHPNVENARTDQRDAKLRAKIRTASDVIAKIGNKRLGALSDEERLTLRSTAADLTKLAES